MHHAAGMGAGELAMPLSGVGAGVLTSPLRPLFSLMALLSSLILESLDPVESLLTSSGNAAALGGAFHDGKSNTTPVKLLILKPFFSHLRHLNFPVRSSALRFALIAPWLAFGPSFCRAVGPAKGPLSFGSLSMSPSFFLLGPGLPRAFGVAGLWPSMTVALLFVPGFGPFRFAAGGASEDGVLAPFMVAVESAGVSAGVGSTIWGAAGVSDGDELGFDSGESSAGWSWGKVESDARDSLSVMILDFAMGFVDIFDAEWMGDVVLRCCSYGLSRGGGWWWRWAIGRRLGRGGSCRGQLAQGLVQLRRVVGP